MTYRKQPEASCAEAKKRIHAVLDGDLMDAAERQALDRHLAGCAGCRETRRELEQIQDTLRQMPDVPLPDEAFDEVLARTTRGTSPSGLSRLASWGLDWRAAAAAAALAAAMWSVWPSGPDQAEVDRAAVEARLVLTLTAQALSRSQQAAIRGVMTDEVSPALNRVPMNMPPASRDEDL